MTTFQYLIEAFLGTLSLILPVSRTLIADFFIRVLHWSEPSNELNTLVYATVALYLLFYFRFDFLGMISAVIKSIFRPTTLSTERRSLDQHILLFFLIVVPCGYLGGVPLYNAIANTDLEVLKSPVTYLLAYLVLAFGFQFSKNWNKRIKGLNHLKLADAALIGALSLLIAYPPVTWIAVLWIGFALTNHHFEAIFKYSYLLVALGLVFSTFRLLHAHTFMEAIRDVGYLNSIAVIAVSLTTVYMLVEHLERTLSEATYKNSRNWCILCAVFYGIMIFI